LLPYEYLKACTGSLMADGNFNSLKPWNADELKLLFGLGGIGFLSLAGLTGLRRWKIFRPLSKQVWADAGDLFSSLRPNKDELGFLIPLVVIMVLGVVFRLEYIFHWIAAGFGTAILTSLFYFPVLIFTGPEKVFANAFVSPLPWGDLLETLSHRLTETWLEWTSGVPLFLVVILMAGWILSLIFHRRISTIRVPIQLSAVLWIFALIILQRPNAWAKVWLFLLPLMLMWAAAGSVGLLRKIRITIFHFPVSTEFGPDQMRAIGNRPPLTLILIGIVLVAGIQQAVWLGR
jgi:hypothetical protein